MTCKCDPQESDGCLFGDINQFWKSECKAELDALWARPDLAMQVLMV